MNIVVSVNERVASSVEFERIADELCTVLQGYVSVPIDAEISVTLVDDAEIAELNSAYRGKTGPTDVLSFELKEELLDPDGKRTAYLLGDVVISLERMQEQAEELGHTWEREFGFLLVHGILHLLGYEHGEDMGEMGRLTEDILAAVGLHR